MPRGARSGPRGLGPMTGRGAGYCAGQGGAGFDGPVPGRGFGMGFGRGRCGWGLGFFGRRRGLGYGYAGQGVFRGPAAAPEMERQILKNQAEALQAELDGIRKRLEDLEAGGGEK